MPDGTIINQTTISTRRPKRDCVKDPAFLGADQMRSLWEDVQTATKNYREEDEERTIAAVYRAEDRIAAARTVDPLGIAYKLRATREWVDQDKGLVKDLQSLDRTARTIATIIRDVEVTSAKPARGVPSRLRHLWETYQRDWTAVSDAMDGADRAMAAERKANVERGTSPAKIEAARVLAAAEQTFKATHDAFSAAPARTIDDAICKLLFVIDQANLDDEEERAVRAAIRVLKKS